MYTWNLSIGARVVGCTLFVQTEHPFVVVAPRTLMSGIASSPYCLLARFNFIFLCQVS